MVERLTSQHATNSKDQKQLTDIGHKKFSAGWDRQICVKTICTWQQNPLSFESHSKGILKGTPRLLFMLISQPHLLILLKYLRLTCLTFWSKIFHIRVRAKDYSLTFQSFSGA